MSKREQLPRLVALLCAHRWAALATTGEEGTAEASMVAYALDSRLDAVYLHLSQLAAHSRNLQRQPYASLVVSEPDPGKGDPQQLARVTLYGEVRQLERGTTEYETGKACYLQHLPAAEPLFDFADFSLYRLAVKKARFVGGFAQAHSYGAAELAEARMAGAD